MLTSLYFSDKRAEDPPKSPVAVGNIDLTLLDVLRQEVEKPVEGSTVVAREILGRHSALVVRFFVLECFLLSCRVICLDLALLAESGQSSHGAGRVPSAD